MKMLVIIALLVLTGCATQQVAEPGTWHQGQKVVHVSKVLACYSEESAYYLLTQLDEGEKNFAGMAQAMIDHNVCGVFGGPFVVVGYYEPKRKDTLTVTVVKVRIPDDTFLWLFQIEQGDRLYES